jgi:hypothetical protein
MTDDSDSEDGGYTLKIIPEIDYTGKVPEIDYTTREGNEPKPEIEDTEERERPNILGQEAFKMELGNLNTDEESSSHD